MGLRAVPLRAVGVRRRAVGLVPGRVRSAAGVVAGVGRVVRRKQLGRFGIGRRAGLRLGSARVARAVHTVVAQLRFALLDRVQPAVRRESRRARSSSDDVCEPCRSRRDHRRRGRRVRRRKAGRRKLGSCSADDGCLGARVGHRSGGQAGSRHGERGATRKRRPATGIDDSSSDEADDRRAGECSQ